MRRGPKPNLNRKEEPRQLSHEERQELERKAREFRKALFFDLTIAEKMFNEDPQIIHFGDGVGETAFHYVVIERHLDLAAKLLVWGEHQHSGQFWNHTVNPCGFNT